MLLHLRNHEPPGPEAASVPGQALDYDFGTELHTEGEQPGVLGRFRLYVFKPLTPAQVDLILPDEYAGLVVARVQSPQYSRVTMKLGDMLDGSFFTEYIKIGRFAYACSSISLY